MAEWSNAADSKSVDGSNHPRVRIPPSPFSSSFDKILQPCPGLTQCRKGLGLLVMERLRYALASPKSSIAYRCNRALMPSSANCGKKIYHIPCDRLRPWRSSARVRSYFCLCASTKRSRLYGACIIRFVEHSYVIFPGLPAAVCIPVIAKASGGIAQHGCGRDPLAP